MFIREDVAHLVGDNFCVADDCVDVGVGMAVDPNVNAAVGYEVALFCGEGGIEVGTLKVYFGVIIL